MNKIVYTMHFFFFRNKSESNERELWKRRSLFFFVVEWKQFFLYIYLFFNGHNKIVCLFCFVFFFFSGSGCSVSIEAKRQRMEEIEERDAKNLEWYLCEVLHKSSRSTCHQFQTRWWEIPFNKKLRFFYFYFFIFYRLRLILGVEYIFFIITMY